MNRNWACKLDLEQSADRGVDCGLVDVLLKVHDLHWSLHSPWQWHLASLNWLSWPSPYLSHIWKPETRLGLWKGLVLGDADLERQCERTSWKHLKDCDEFPLSLVRWCLRRECPEFTSAWVQYALTSLICTNVTPLSSLMKNPFWLDLDITRKKRWFEFLSEVLDREWLDCSLSQEYISVSADEWDTSDQAWVLLVDTILTENNEINGSMTASWSSWFWHPQSESE